MCGERETDRQKHKNRDRDRGLGGDNLVYRYMCAHVPLRGLLQVCVPTESDYNFTHYRRGPHELVCAHTSALVRAHALP